MLFDDLIPTEAIERSDDRQGAIDAFMRESRYILSAYLTGHIGIEQAKRELGEELTAHCAPVARMRQ